MPPISARSQNTQICITLNGEGQFRRAEVSLLKNTPILVSETSAARTGVLSAANPLADKLAYCAGDGIRYGLNSNYFARYIVQLSEWCSSEFKDAKACIILEYIKQAKLIADLIKSGVLTIKAGELGKINVDGKMLAPGEAWIRWRVEARDETLPNTWDDPGTFARWECFESSKSDAVGLCMALGVTGRIARIHPKGIRNSRDRAKLISSNDNDGHTFKGRFLEAKQAASLGYMASQKAHSALRWLIAGQAYKNGDQVIVAWAVSGKPIPKVVADSEEIRKWIEEEAPKVAPNVVALTERNRRDDGQLFAKQVNTFIRGYAANLTDREDIVVMALDSATPGRVAITYYRELQASEFLARIKSWHERTAWPQSMGKYRGFIGAPSLHDIAETAYGRLLDGKLKKSIVERLLPCIVDGRPIPRDLVSACVRQATNPVGKEHWEWERSLGIACALIRGTSIEENYSMSLEEDSNSRSYLFGRLLAIAEKIEGRALYLAKETRITTAERLMQRFSYHPSATWRTIELGFSPSIQRLRVSRPKLLYVWKCLLDDVISRFRGDDFIRTGRLDAEFLLGYYCQRAALRWDDSRDDDQEEQSQEPPLV